MFLKCSTQYDGKVTGGDTLIMIMTMIMMMMMMMMMMIWEYCDYNVHIYIYIYRSMHILVLLTGISWEYHWLDMLTLLKIKLVKYNDYDHIGNCCAHYDGNIMQCGAQFVS